MMSRITKADYLTAVADWREDCEENRREGERKEAKRLDKYIAFANAVLEHAGITNRDFDIAHMRSRERDAYETRVAFKGMMRSGCWTTSAYASRDDWNVERRICVFAGVVSLDGSELRMFGDRHSWTEVTPENWDEIVKVLSQQAREMVLSPDTWTDIPAKLGPFEDDEWPAVEKKHSRWNIYKDLSAEMAELLSSPEGLPMMTNVQRYMLTCLWLIAESIANLEG